MKKQPARISLISSCNRLIGQEDRGFSPNLGRLTFYAAQLFESVCGEGLTGLRYRNVSRPDEPQTTQRNKALSHSEHQLPGMFVSCIVLCCGLGGM